MKTFEEYSKSVFEKRNAIIKQRKKRTKAAAVSLCAVVAVSIGAFAINGQFISNEAEINTGKAESAQCVTNPASDPLADSFNAKDSAEYDSFAPQDFDDAEAIPQQQEMLDSNMRVTEIAPEIAVTNQSLNEVGEIPDIATQPFSPGASQAVDGENKNTDELKNQTVPQFTNEEIIAAAYSALDGDRKSEADKNSAEIMIEHKSTGENTYVVIFETPNGGYVKIKIDPETLNAIE